MDIGNLFEKLDGEYRTMFLGLALIFPMAYADCWKLSPSFSSLETIPQIILSLSVAIILMIGGLMLDLIYLVAFDKNNNKLKLSLPILIIPTVPSTALLIVGLIDSILNFFWIYLGFAIVCLVQYSRNISYEKRNRKEEDCPQNNQEL